MRSASAHPNLTVLVVEDDAVVRQAVHRNLSAAGYQVLVAENPDSACKLLRDCVIHALILDVRLQANRSGLEVLRFARVELQRRELLAIILTGVVLSRDEERAIRREGAYVFYKTVGIQELLQFLDERLAR